MPAGACSKISSRSRESSRLQSHRHSRWIRICRHLAAAAARLQVQGDPQSEADSLSIGSIRVVTPDYFKTLGIPLVAGRTFRDSDLRPSQFVTVINRSLGIPPLGS